jgi:hypothetical protein
MPRIGDSVSGFARLLRLRRRLLTLSSLREVAQALRFLFTLNLLWGRKEATTAKPPDRSRDNAYCE